MLLCTAGFVNMMSYLIHGLMIALRNNCNFGRFCVVMLYFEGTSRKMRVPPRKYSRKMHMRKKSEHNAG